MSKIYHEQPCRLDTQYHIQGSSGNLISLEGKAKDPKGHLCHAKFISCRDREVCWKLTINPTSSSPLPFSNRHPRLPWWFRQLRICLQCRRPRFNALKKGMATHSSILAWRIPLTEEPDGLHSPWGRKESNTNEELTLSLLHFPLLLH